MRNFLTLSLICLVTSLVATVPARASTWYAAPGAGGTTCSQTIPCAANYALETKPPADGDTVVLAGGDYAITTQISVLSRISIEGATSGTPTRLIGTPPIFASTLSYIATTALPTHISDLQATSQYPSSAGLQAFNVVSAPMVVERVRGEGGGSNGWGIVFSQSAAGSGAVLRDSVARATGSGGIGLRNYGPPFGSATAELRNVVADSRDPTGYGVEVSGGFGPGPGDCGSLTVRMKNSYARSFTAARDVTARAGSGCTGVLDSSNSNWRDKTLQPGGSVNSISDQHSVEPQFVDEAGGNYRLLTGSLLRDAGVADDLIGSLDLDRQPRLQGPAPDIGAYEFPVPVPVATIDSSAPFGTELAFSPKSFLPDVGKPPSVARKKKPRGTTISFKLSEAATVVFTVQRKVKGRKKGKKCLTKRKRGKRCTTYKAIRGSFSRAASTGANSFRFTGFINGKALKRGNYRMSGLPTDAANNHGQAFRGTFKILGR